LLIRLIIFTDVAALTAPSKSCISALATAVVAAVAALPNPASLLLLLLLLFSDPATS
jgi:hypothetical protein